MITTMICVEWCLTRYPIKIFVTDAIRVRLAPYSIHDYLYLYSRTFVFVFVFEAIRIRIRIKVWKQIWFYWYPSVFDSITSLCLTNGALAKISLLVKWLDSFFGYPQNFRISDSNSDSTVRISDTDMRWLISVGFRISGYLLG